MSRRSTHPLPATAGKDPQPVQRLSVWPTGTRTPYTQLAEGGYLLPDTAHATAAIPPDVAAYAIAAYTQPGGTVLDPDCGAGAVVVEAARAGRHSLGLTESRHWHRVTTANLAAIATGSGAGVLLTTTSARVELPPDGRAGKGRVDLVLTALRGPATRSAHPASPRPGPSPGPGPDSDCDPLPGLRAVLSRCRPLLHPASHVLVIGRTRRPDGYLLDLPTTALAAGRAVGLEPVDRCIALLAPITGDRLTVRASLAHRRATARHQRVTGHPITLAAHLTVLVFTPVMPAASPATGAVQDSRRPQPSPSAAADPGERHRRARRHGAAGGGGRRWAA
jgi:modification methylase